MTRHVHYDVMMEWAADTSKVVQSQRQATGEWFDHTTDPPRWLPSTKYRIKPEKKPDVVWFWFISPEMQSYFGKRRDVMHNLRLTFDGETGKLIEAEVLK